MDNNLASTPTPTESVPPAPVPVPPTPKKSSSLIWVLSFTVLLLSAITGFFIWQNIQLRQQLVTTQSTPAPSPTSVPTTNPTADWKIYTNNLVGYSFKYPKDWQFIDLTEGKQIEVYFQPEKTKSVGEILFEEIPALNYERQLNSGGVINDVLIGSESAKCMGDGEAKTWCFLTVGGSKYMSIMIVKLKDEKYNATLDQILSTFRFTE